MNNSVCLIEIKPGVGGEEAKLWAADLLTMYRRFSEKQKWQIKVLDENLLRVSGQGCFQWLKYETGVHRVQRVPATERYGRIHTSAAVVLVTPEINEQEVHLKQSDMEWQFYRSGGHGGQNVNKVSSAVRLTHKPSGVVVTCSRERNQYQNRQIALSLLTGRLEQIEADKHRGVVSAFSASAGHGERSEKIRTYNFPQNRLTDHRLNKSFHNLDQIMAGNLNKLLGAFLKK
jgi:peptide chain release factor 1